MHKPPQLPLPLPLLPQEDDAAMGVRPPSMPPMLVSWVVVAAVLVVGLVLGG